MPTLTDLSTIRDLCARYDFALSKGFGQNFIINPGICPRIAEASGIGPGWGALEVGRRCWKKRWPIMTISSWC